MSKSTIEYFGYGSLVNLDSLRTPYLEARRATLRGWQRTWLARPRVADSFAAIENLAFLSVIRVPGKNIDGLVITDHASSLKSLDERESLYSRVSLHTDELELHDEFSHNQESAGAASGQFLYVADACEMTQRPHILRSYLDVVMQGYLFQFGENGLTQFMQTTQNFDCPILEDRSDPLYPRATVLSDSEISLFESLCPQNSQAGDL